MSDRQFKCDMPNCGFNTKFIRAMGSEIPMPRDMEMSQLQRKAPLGELMRNFLVECPLHGQRIIQEPGHHIDIIPKKRKTRKP